MKRTTTENKISPLPLAPAPKPVKVRFSPAGPRPKAKITHLPASPDSETETIPSRPNLKRLPDSDWLYQYPDQPNEYWVRPYFRGKQRKKKLKSVTRKAANIEAADLYKKIANYEGAGISRDPFARSEEISVREICEFYKQAGCPGEKNSPRTGLALRQEVARVNNWILWPGSSNGALQYSHEENRKYHAWRTRQVMASGRGKGGDRAVDKDLVTLSNIFRHAARNSKRTGITLNPIAQDRERFRISQQVTHCRDHMPRNAEELNSLARYMFGALRSEVLGWQMLFQAMAGQRSNEILRLRMDAKTKEQPGFVDGKRLYLYRSYSSKGTYGHVELYADLKEVIEAHRIWHMKRYPGGSPWYFPSPENPMIPVGVTALTHRLVKAAAETGQGHRTAHGVGRAYRVNVLRSQGFSDAEIALWIGHKTGGKLIVEVYGEGLDYKICYRPEDMSPAWARWLPITDLSGPIAEQQQLL